MAVDAAVGRADAADDGRGFVAGAAGRDSASDAGRVGAAAGRSGSPTTARCPGRRPSAGGGGSNPPNGVAVARRRSRRTCSRGSARTCSRGLLVLGWPGGERVGVWGVHLRGANFIGAHSRVRRVPGVGEHGALPMPRGAGTRLPASPPPRQHRFYLTAARLPSAPVRAGGIGVARLRYSVAIHEAGERGATPRCAARRPTTERRPAQPRPSRTAGGIGRRGGLIALREAAHGAVPLREALARRGVRTLASGTSPRRCSRSRSRRQTGWARRVRCARGCAARCGRGDDVPPPPAAARGTRPPAVLASPPQTPPLTPPLTRRRACRERGGESTAVGASERGAEPAAAPGIAPLDALKHAATQARPSRWRCGGERARRRRRCGTAAAAAAVAAAAGSAAAASGGRRQACAPRRRLRSGWPTPRSPFTASLLRRWATRRQRATPPRVASSSPPPLGGAHAAVGGPPPRARRPLRAASAPPTHAHPPRRRPLAARVRARDRGQRLARRGRRARAVLAAARARGSRRGWACTRRRRRPRRRRRSLAVWAAAARRHATRSHASRRQAARGARRRDRRRRCALDRPCRPRAARAEPRRAPCFELAGGLAPPP